MKFEIGKYYKHTTGEIINVLGEITTTLYGNTLIAETNDVYNIFKPVGKSEECTVNWIEVGREEWMKNFSTTGG